MRMPVAPWSSQVPAFAFSRLQSTHNPSPSGEGCSSGALLTSLWSQYASSRVHSWRRRELDHLQTQLADRPAVWANEAWRLDLISRAYGKATKWLTLVSGILLVGGFMFLARYAFLNVSDRTDVNRVVVQQDRDDRRPPTTTVPAPVPEKRGLEDIPEPLPRPATQTPTTGGSEKK